MHTAERTQVILALLQQQRFVRFSELAERLSASAATVRRDLDRLQREGQLVRVHGGIEAARHAAAPKFHLHGTPFTQNAQRNIAAKRAIAKAAANLCQPGDSIIIDGGTTTLQMCAPLEPLKVQVLTNSLHIATELMEQPDTDISIFGGVLFREQNIVLDPFSDQNSFGQHAKRLFLSAAAVNQRGLFQSDIILVQSERKLLGMADETVVLADSSKFSASAGHLVCELGRVHTLVTDSGIPPDAATMVKAAGVNLITVDV